MTQEIKLLNNRLASELGSNHGQPRFQWRFAPEVFYYFRNPTAVTFTRHCWADLVGKVWMLCQSAPAQWLDHEGHSHQITRESWSQSFHGEFPFPDKGMYVAHSETALAPGVLPDAEETAVWIASIRAQMAKNYEQHVKETTERLAKAREDNEKEFMSEAEEWFPYNWKNGQAVEPGTRGGHISFGGI